MGKTKPKELQDIMYFPVITRPDVPDENRQKVAREVSQQLYSELIRVKGADYLRENEILPLEQWSRNNFWEQSHALRSCYQMEYEAQENAKGERIRPYAIGFLSALILFELGLQFVGSHYKTKKEHAKADFSYCHNLLLKAQSEETKTFVRKNATGPYSGRLCELVLAEEKDLND